MNLRGRDLSRCVALLLMCALVVPQTAHATPKPLTPEKAHAYIRHIGAGNLVGVQLENGNAYAGRIVSIGANSFGLERYGYEEPTQVAYSYIVYLQKRLPMAYLSHRPVTPEAVHARLLKRGLGNWAGVQLLNGVVVYGAIINIGDSSFGLQLYGDSEVTPVAYSDVVYLQTGLTGGQKALFIILPIAAGGAMIGTAVAMHNNMPKQPPLPTIPPVSPVY